MVNMDPVWRSVRPAASGKDLLFQNAAVAGTTSTDWAVGGARYVSARNQFKGAVAPLPKALLIELGTNDAKDPASGSAGSTWTANVTATIAGLRSDLELPNLPVVLVVMPATIPSSAAFPPETWSNWSAIRSAQLALSIPNMTLVQAPDGPYADGLHLNTSANTVLAGLISAQVP